MLGPGTKGSLKLEVLVIVVRAGLEVSRRCTSPPGEMLRLWGSGDEFWVTAIVPSLVSGFVHHKIYFAFSMQD